MCNHKLPDAARHAHVLTRASRCVWAQGGHKEDDPCTFIDEAETAEQTCCLVPNPVSPKEKCFSGMLALTMGCCDSPAFWKRQGYDTSGKTGECYCGDGCFKTFDEKRDEMHCSKLSRV